METEGILDRLPGAIAKAESLPSPPTVALEVLRLTRQEDADVQSLTRVLARDPVLSAKLLKLANSSLFRRGDAVTSLDLATMRLGLKTVQLMALSFSLASGLVRKSDDAGFDYEEYWRRSLTMAVSGRALAQRMKASSPDEAFLCGLLGRLGQVVIAQCLTQEYAALLDDSEGVLPSAALERERLGFDFHDVGGALLAAWELPDLISGTVCAWGDPSRLPEQADPALIQLTRVMQVADAMSAVLCERHRAGSALSRLHAIALDSFGLSDEEIDAMLISLEGSVAEMGAMLDVGTVGESYQEIVDRARAQLVQISLGTAFDLEQTHHRAAELERQNLALASRANTDKLTGIPNRAHFDEVLERLFGERPERLPSKEVGILMIDVDHFKLFNDTHGHAVGDEVLRCVAGTLASATREMDIVARYGGEEFVVLLPETSFDTLEAVAERVRSRIEDAVCENAGARLSVTVSVGGACTAQLLGPAEAANLLATADRLLYEAKGKGRNRCECRRIEDSASGRERMPTSTCSRGPRRPAASSM